MKEKKEVKNMDGESMSAKVTLQSPDGTSLTIEIEDGFSVEDVFAAAGKYLSGGKLSVNGEPADEDAPVEDGDIVEEHRTARGN